MQTIKLLSKSLLALFYQDDINTFWQIREQVLHKSCLSGLWNIFAKIIRKHYSSAIPFSANINRFSTPHGFYGIFISKNAYIGKGCRIFQHVIIGSTSEGAPSIGDNVLIGSGAIIVGKVKIGNNVKIGAGAVVAQDIPDNSTVVMDKPRIIKN